LECLSYAFTQCSQSSEKDLDRERIVSAYLSISSAKLPSAQGLLRFYIHIVQFRGVATGVYIGIYTPLPKKNKINPSKLFIIIIIINEIYIAQVRKSQRN